MTYDDPQKINTRNAYENPHLLPLHFRNGSVRTTRKPPVIHSFTPDNHPLQAQINAQSTTQTIEGDTEDSY